MDDASGYTVYSYNDAADRVKKIEAYVGGSWQTVISDIDYLPFGGSTGYGYGNGIWNSRELDNDGRVSRLTAGSVQDLSYSYNVVDDITQISNSKNTNASQSYAYDNLSRLKSANASIRNELFNYDANANRTSHSVSGVTTRIIEMNTKIIGTVLVLLALIVGGVSIYIDRMNAINFEANGIVQEFKWDTKNHNMPLFKIKEEHRVKTLQDSRVVLQPQDIKVGDKFEKKAGSKVCLINNKEVICVK